MKIGESKVSQRGSVVIPKAIREALNVKEGESVEWYVEDEEIMVKKKIPVIDLTAYKPEDSIHIIKEKKTVIKNEEA